MTVEPQLSRRSHRALLRQLVVRRKRASPALRLATDVQGFNRESVSRDVFGICLAFRNAAPYLREWLLFHRAVGFNRFYLYNNDSTDAYRDVLQSFLASRGADFRIELIDWPGYHQQNAIYQDCLGRARGEVEWLALIDDDEFLFPANGDSLRAIFSEFADAAGLAVCWWLYGTGGHIHSNEDWVIRRFERRAAEANSHVKVIVQPDKVVRPIAGGHHVQAVPGNVIVDEHGQPMSSPFATTPSGKKLRLNHYVTKSVEEMIVRRTSRDIGYGDRQKLSLSEWIRLDRDWNVVKDTCAHAFIPDMEVLSRRIGT